MTKEKRTPRRHPGFGQIARILPETKSRKAALLSHVLECALCRDAALSILQTEIEPPNVKDANYDAAFASSTEKATRAFVEERMRSKALAEGLLKIRDPEARRQRALEQAREDPWSFTVSLLGEADCLMETDPKGAIELAELAAIVAEGMNPKEHPASRRMKVWAEVYFLLGEGLYRLFEVAGGVPLEEAAGEGPSGEIPALRRHPLLDEQEESDG